MLACRSLTTLRIMRKHTEKISVRCFSTPAKKGAEEEEGGLSAFTERREQMSKWNKSMIWGMSDDALPAPVLPEDPKELARLDQADQRFRTRMDGAPRHVVIRQLEKSNRQAPLNPESVWTIQFSEDDGMTAEKWDNSLMGWTSNADPYQNKPPMYFSNAAEALYFVKKRGWKYVVNKPILRVARDDDAQYQDNFLSQKIALQLKDEGVRCKEWERKSSGTSHYIRPLKYHGDGTVRQHGPNLNKEVLPHKEGYYKIR